MPPRRSYPLGEREQEPVVYPQHLVGENQLSVVHCSELKCPSPLVFQVFFHRNKGAFGFGIGLGLEDAVQLEEGFRIGGRDHHCASAVNDAGQSMAAKIFGPGSLPVHSPYGEALPGPNPGRCKSPQVLKTTGIDPRRRSPNAPPERKTAPRYLFKIPVGVFRWDGHSFRGDQCQGVKPQNFGLFLQIGGDVFYLRILRERIAQQMKRPAGRI